MSNLALLFPLAGKPQDLALKQLAELSLKDVGQTKAEDTEVVPYFLNSGFTHIEEHAYHYLAYRNDREMYESMIQIEKDGCDGIMLDCWYDPGLLEARQALDIPVAGSAQSSLLAANMMAKNFALVTFTNLAIHKSIEVVERYCLKEKLVCAKAITTSFEDEMKAFVDAREEIEEFKKVSRKCIADGAELIIPACMALSTVVNMAPGCEKDYLGGIKEIDGVAVMDVLAVMVKVAEGMVALKKAGNPWISRKLGYAKASKNCEKRAPSYFKYQGSGCWHY